MITVVGVDALLARFAAGIVLGEVAEEAIPATLANLVPVVKWSKRSQRSLRRSPRGWLSLMRQSS